ncbi:hypothetical protein MAP00_004041 [Monascus purpureus]|nr:hypothetical protein MAP00_004041 [Monascus purpureus]
MSPNTAESYHAASTSSRMTPSASSIAIDQDSSPAFEGYSSLSAQSAYASQFLETAISRGSFREESPKMATALSTLKQIVNMQNQGPQVSSQEVRFPTQKIGSGDGDGHGIRDLKMPPMEAVISLLRNVKENPSNTSLFGSYYSFMTLDEFTEKCREVYFCTEDYSPATFIMVNCGLCNLFLELSFMVRSSQTKEAYQKYLQICKYNVESALAGLNLLLPATKDNIQALTLGAMHAIEISRPSFAWTLTSTAAQLCQALGYHRASSMENDTQKTRENKLRTFWTLYCLNKALSLRLGRASVIQDYDISLPSENEDLTAAGPWRAVVPLWIRLAMIQGKVYELLYSPAALCQSEGERVAHAERLAAEMRLGVIEPFERLSINPKDISDLDSLYLRFDRVSRLSVLTLIYRAIPPQGDAHFTFTMDCIKTARNALEAHLTCMTSLKESDESLKCSYMHWTIMYAPFVPFIVIFCHIIEFSSNNPNTESSTHAAPSSAEVEVDLNRLEEFVLSLESLTTLSEAIFKLHRLCQVLFNIAKLYTEAKTKAKIQAQDPELGQERNMGDKGLVEVGEEFDIYLSALGFAPGQGSAPVGLAAGYGYYGVGLGGMEGIGSFAMGTGMSMGMSMPNSELEGNSHPHHAHLHTHSETHPSANDGDDNPTSVTPSTALFQSTQLGNWFSGNRYMMGLLEEDLSQFDPSSWS